VQHNNYAPVSQIPTVNSGTTIKWLPTKHGNGVRMNIRFRVAQVVVYAPGSPVVPRPIFWAAGGISTAACADIPLNFSDAFYFPGYVATLTSLFDFFYVYMCRLTLSPRKNTSDETTIVMAYAKDPEWVESHGLVDSGGHALADEANLTSISNCCTSVAYARDCVVVADVDSKSRFYTAGPYSGGQYNYNTTNAADIRQSTNGVFLINGTVGSSDTNSMVIADVYMEVDLELENFTTLIANGVTQTRSLRRSAGERLARLEMRLRELELDKDEWAHREDGKSFEEPLPVRPLSKSSSRK